MPRPASCSSTMRRRSASKRRSADTANISPSSQPSGGPVAGPPAFILAWSLRFFDSLDLELQDFLGAVGDLDLVADPVADDPDDPLPVGEDGDAVPDGLGALVVDEELLELRAPARAQGDELVA